MNIAVLLAGGKGLRMGQTECPKQFMEIKGKPVCVYTMEAFQRCEEVDAICIVCIPDWQPQIIEWMKKYNITKFRWMVENGETRERSVNNALVALKKECQDDDIVMIHDIVRPIVSNEMILQNIDAVKKFGACNTVYPAQDTIVRSVDGVKITDVPLRSELYHGQCPQSSTLGLFYKAHDDYGRMTDKPDVTDEMKLLLMQNQTAVLVPGSKFNIKITSQDDLLLCKAMMDILNIS